MAKQWWKVPFSASYHGVAYVEANTKSKAEEMVEDGDFDDESWNEANIDYQPDAAEPDDSKVET